MFLAKSSLSLLALFIFNPFAAILSLPTTKRGLEDELNRLTKHYQKISREKKECCFNSDEDRSKYSSDSEVVGDMNMWTGSMIHDTNGPYYVFTDKESGLVLEADLQNGGRVYLGNPYTEVAMQHWKLSFCGRDQICLQHRQSEKYLSFESVGTCYRYTLSTDETPFYLRW